MEIFLYTNKQILGGFLIILIISLLFVVNLTMNYGNVQYFTNVNLSYFITPLIFTLSIVAIMYIVALNKSIKTTLDKYILSDEFNMKTCPLGYDTIVDGNNVECQPTCPEGYEIQNMGNNNFECQAIGTGSA
tara:strand:- start:134 stop:529 length:396 start_codon:yes stop_codon:yes gene_type:complete